MKNHKTVAQLRSRQAEDAQPSRAGSLALLGGALCLNFTNTTSGRGTLHCQEHLRRFEHLLAWARHAGAIDEAAAGALEGLRLAPRANHRIVARAVALREALRDVFHAVVVGASPPMGALAVLNRNLAEAMAAAVLEATPQGFAMRWPQGIAKPERLLWPVARSAAELLAGDDLGRLKVCAGNDCGWMFLDTSRSGRRRWCEMEVCGSRAKMRRYHQRRRRAAGNSLL